MFSFACRPQQIAPKCCCITVIITLAAGVTLQVEQIGSRIESLGSQTVKGKGKSIPLQALTDPEDSRRLRLPVFKTIGT
jgi:hypothetical protein